MRLQCCETRIRGWNDNADATDYDDSIRINSLAGDERSETSESRRENLLLGHLHKLNALFLRVNAICFSIIFLEIYTVPVLFMRVLGFLASIY